jgi:hypothetical protein
MSGQRLVKRAMKSISPFALALVLVLARSTITRADAVSELAGFSVFDKIDINELAQSDAKTMHGPPMNGRFLSVQSVYVVPGAPAAALTAMKKWDATKHRELKVFLHGDLPPSPGPSDFARLKNAPDNSSVRALKDKTQKMSGDLQISKEDAKKSGADFVGFWSDVLSRRAKTFSSGGTAALPPYDAGGETIRVNEEVNTLLKNQGKIRKQFSEFLGETGIGRGAGSLTPELYWELLDVDDQGVVTNGASYSRGQQAGDILYYASGGYYVALTLYQLWPVTANGKPSTLVWRGDMISSAALADLHGVERLGSESAMMKDIAKAIALFRKDVAR